MNKLDTTLLADVFPVSRKPRRKAKSQYEFKGRKAYIQQEGKEWVGWFDDDHSVQYAAPTKGEVISDMKEEA